jgi:hypothetical protein
MRGANPRLLFFNKSLKAADSGDQVKEKIMKVKDFLEVLKKHNIPEDVRIISDSGWECGATDIEAIYYNKEKNSITLVQGDTMYLNSHIGEYLIYIDEKVADKNAFNSTHNVVGEFVPNKELLGTSVWKNTGYAILDKNNRVVVKPLEEKT